jgi:hypothetical protein
MSKFRHNQKVTPISKTSDGRTKGLENSVSWKRAQEKGQDFLYVRKAPLNGDYPEYMCSDEFKSEDKGDYFHERDLVKYNN